MLIKKLKLHNFRQYIGDQEIVFSTDHEKNVTVLIGVNTSGKTTLVRAFEWILYNKNDFDDKVLLNQNVADHMQLGETQSVTGELTIEHNGVTYEISRKQIYTKTGTTVRGNVSTANILYQQPDGQTKTRIESEFQSNIERILPKALSSYFFFGGERIGAISTRSDIEASVKGLMGLDVLYNAMTHLRTVITRLNKSKSFEGHTKAQEAQKKLDAAIQRKEVSEEELNTVEEQLEYYQTEKEKFAALLKANEETSRAQKKREQLSAVITNLEDRIEKDKKEMVRTFSRDAFAYFSLPLLKRAVEMLDDAVDETESVPDMNSSTIDYILKRGVCICGTCISEGSAAERNLLAERAKQPPEFIGTLVRRYREQAMDYISSSDDYYESMAAKFATLRENQRELGFRKDEMKELNEVLKNAKDVDALEQQYQNAYEKCRTFDARRGKLREMIGSCKKDIENYEKSLESYSRSSLKNARIIQYIAYAEEVFQWVQTAYKTRENSVRGKLEEKVNANFAKMYHGKRTITIDEKYRVKYVDVTTEESDGLKAVKSFAFVAGLVDLAKEALTAADSKEADIGPQYYPLVMDAPFSNVDETHIRNISQILPQSAEQVIIAVMKKDWEPAEEIMNPVVGKSYFIQKDMDSEGREIDTMTHIKEAN